MSHPHSHPRQHFSGHEEVTPSLHERIAVRAFFLWLAEGKPEGQALRHWLLSEQWERWARVEHIRHAWVRRD